MVISLNSLDSNTSPHSRHSTNSESSSRDTMRTRGCLHSAMLLLFSGTEDGVIGFIDSVFAPARAGQVNVAGRLAAFERCVCACQVWTRAARSLQDSTP